MSTSKSEVDCYVDLIEGIRDELQICIDCPDELDLDTVERTAKGANDILRPHFHVVYEITDHLIMFKIRGLK